EKQEWNALVQQKQEEQEQILETERIKLREEVQKEKEQLFVELKEQQRQFEETKELVADHNLRLQKRIKLNVGGRQFETTQTTLTSVPHSMLANMFSGRHKLDKDQDGCYF